MFGTLADFDRLLAEVHARGHEARDRPRRQPHLERAPLVRRVALVDATTPNATGTGGARRDRASPPGARAPSRRTGRRSSPARRGSSTRRPASTTCTCFARSSRTSTGRTPTVREAVYSMMRWWLDRGVDGFRMDVINLISKDPTLPDGTPRGGAGARPTAFAHYVLRAADRTSSSQEMHREVFAGRDRELLTVGEMPGVTVEEARRLTDPAPAEVDMVFQFEHVEPRPRRRQVGRPPARPARPQGDRSGAGRRASPRSAGTACTGTTTTSRGSCRGSATTASTGSRSAKMLGDGPPPAPRDALRLPGRGARDDERAASPRSTTSATSSRSTTTPRRRPRPASRRTACSARLADDGPRQRAHADAVGRRRRRPASRPARPWLPVNPNHRAINAAAAVRRPGLGVPPLPALIELRHTEPSSPTATSRCCCPTTTDVYAFTRRLGDVRAARARQLHGRRAPVDLRGVGDAWSHAQLVLGNDPGACTGRPGRLPHRRSHRGRPLVLARPSTH